jgi:hypothetical protein
MSAETSCRIAPPTEQLLATAVAVALAQLVALLTRVAWSDDVALCHCV